MMAMVKLIVNQAKKTVNVTVTKHHFLHNKKQYQYKNHDYDPTLKIPT